MANYTVSSGQTSSGIALGSGDMATVYAGGVVSNTTVSSGGVLDVEGGQAVGTVLNGSLSGSNFGLSVTSGTLQSTTVLSGGVLAQGATVSGIVLGGAGSAVLLGIGGSVTNAVIGADGFLVEDGGSTSGVTVLSGGVFQQTRNGTGQNVTVSSGGTAYVSASVSGVVLRSGGTLVLSGTASGVEVDSGALLIVSGGLLSGVDVQAGGAVLVEGGTVSGVSGNAGGVFSSGNVLQQGMTPSQLAPVLSGAAVGSGSTLFVLSGGTVGGTLVGSGGSETVVGGTASGDVVAGTQTVVSGTVSGTVVLSGGVQTVSSGATVVGTVLSGGTEEVFGVASGTVVNSGGVLSTINGATAFNTVVNNGGVEVGTFTDATINAGGVQSAYGGSGTVVLSGGIQVVEGGPVYDETVSSGGLADLSKLYGGQVSGLMVSRGGAVISGYYLSGTNATVQTGASLLSIQPSITGTVSGGLTTSQTVVNGLTVQSGVHLGYGHTTVGSGGDLVVNTGEVAAFITVSSGGVLDVEGGQAVETSLTSGAILRLSGGSLDELGLVPGATLDLLDLAYAASNTASIDPTTNILTVSGGGKAFSTLLAGDYAGQHLVLSQDATGGTAVTDAVACYVEGTLILTEQGERPVEQLAPGNAVVTVTGELRPVRWIGRRGYRGRFLLANPGIRPVRFRAGSLGNGLPRRDLLVSPEHAMFLEGMLIPARLLVNGTSVARDTTLTTVQYFHVELDSHDVLLAEGAPSESFVDDNNRGIFHNGAEFAALYPEAGPPGGFCAPRVEEGYRLEMIRRRLAEVAGAQADAA